MLLPLFISFGLVVVPASIIFILSRIEGSRVVNSVRFFMVVLIFAPLVLGLRKLVTAPLTWPNMQHYLGGAVEQIVLVAAFFACGLPGLLWRRAPRMGFLFAYITIGAAFTFILTAGPIALRGLQSGLPEILAYVAIALFLFLWAQGGKKNDGLSPNSHKDHTQRVEPTFRS